MQYTENLKEILSTCHYICRRLSENAVLIEPPDKAREVMEDFRNKAQHLQNAFQFLNGINMPFDVEVVKRVCAEYIRNEFSQAAQVELERALWDLLERRIMMPLPKTRQRKTYKVALYREIENRVRNGEKLSDVCRDLDPDHPENLKAAFYNHQKRSGKNFSVKKIQGK